ncbi:MAG: nitrogen regulation protein NR(I) [Sphingomonadales bacterium]|jgi:two-component system nitrogen regulation response regulator GlnG
MSKIRTILVADDDAAIRTVVSQALSRAGFNVRTTGTASGLWQWVNEGEGDVVVTDVVMPDENGLELIPRIQKLRPNLPIIVMSAQNTLATAVRATEVGAYEYLPKPFNIKELQDVVQAACNAGRGQGTSQTSHMHDDELPLVGRSAAMQDVYRTIARIVSTDLTVMVTGESGTGKELVARALHDLSPRKNGPFVPVNMAAIPRELIESELFGHERGAFTGAVNRVAGKFEQAQNGTLFLDEIGDMPIDAQTRLLRVLQEDEYTPVGGRTSIKTNVRIVAATNKNPKSLVDGGLLREDLFYRLNVIPIRLPSLRERWEDVPLLATHFLKQAEASGLPKKTLSADAIDVLQNYRWPGNVRELENLIRRLAALYTEEVITPKIIEMELRGDEPSAKGHNTDQGLAESVEYHISRYFAAHGNQLPPDGLYERIMQEVERPLIIACLTATNGNQLRAAELLGLNRNTLRKKIRLLEINIDKTAKSS